MPLVILNEVNNLLDECFGDVAVGGDVTVGSSRNRVIPALVAALSVSLAPHL
jgi:hypothetical protein